MPAAFTFDSAQLNLQDIKGITVSTIQPDTNSDQFVRLIQIYTTDPTVQTNRPALVLAMYGGNQTTGDQSELEIHTPTLVF